MAHLSVTQLLELLADAASVIIVGVCTGQSDALCGERVEAV
jgi:hypothetical protein